MPLLQISGIASFPVDNVTVVVPAVFGYDSTMSQ